MGRPSSGLPSFESWLAVHSIDHLETDFAAIEEEEVNEDGCTRHYYCKEQSIGERCSLQSGCNPLWCKTKFSERSIVPNQTRTYEDKTVCVSNISGNIMNGVKTVGNEVFSRSSRLQISPIGVSTYRGSGSSITIYSLLPKQLDGLAK